MLLILINNYSLRLFQVMDVNGDGSISFTEFLAAAMDPRDVDVQEINKAFSLLDRDGKGYITYEDLRRVNTTRMLQNSNVF